jgi:hypothetical protein
MEVRHSRASRDAVQAERRAVVVELWAELGKPPVDARLLASIQSRLVAMFGKPETVGPAAIARVLADEGAELKHPEIIETDAAWRQSRIETNANESALAQFTSPAVMTLATAENLIAELEEARQRYEMNQDGQGLAQLRNIAYESRRLADTIARNRSGEQTIRHEQGEIAEWLKVWLQTPALFNDWLELRKRSDEFRARFPMDN